jgi:SAM domain (Sterile alpha motif)
MPQIADWINQLGMSEYAQRFADNGINFAALPHLTDQDLKDVGVLLGQVKAGHQATISRLID